MAGRVGGRGFFPHYAAAARGQRGGVGRQPGFCPAPGRSSFASGRASSTSCLRGTNGHRTKVVNRILRVLGSLLGPLVATFAVAAPPPRCCCLRLRCRARGRVVDRPRIVQTPRRRRPDPGVRAILAQAAHERHTTGGIVVCISRLDLERRPARPGTCAGQVRPPGLSRNSPGPAPRAADRPAGGLGGWAARAARRLMVGLSAP